MKDDSSSRLIGCSRAIARTMEQVRHLSATNASVLIEGEPGTGRELVAHAIHQSGPRGNRRFIAVDCSALPGERIEGELFGFEAGADADLPGPASGKMELADHGTLFLGEIGDLPAAVQARLLRVLQDREFERVGGERTIKVDVRVMAATAHDLSARVADGRFREDLFRRLAMVRVSLPPLRERSEDIPLLVQHFVRETSREHGRRVRGASRGVLERLMRHPWPGNVRELRNTIEGMVVSAAGRRPLDLTDLPPTLREPASEIDRLEIVVGTTIEHAERQLIAATLRHTGHDKPRAAAMLGMGLRTLYRKIKRYGIR
jgi:DNA-binding NtrC family response regulator